MTISIDARKPGDLDLVSAVRDATEKAKGQKKTSRFSFSESTPGERITSALFGLYLGYAVARLPSVFTFLFVPRLPMITMLIFTAILVLSVPVATWQKLWKASGAARGVTALGFLGVATAPVGMWLSGSIYYFRDTYAISLAVFFCAFVFLRDRANLRRAIAIFVLCVAAISARTLVTFDPNPVRYDEQGFQIAQEDLREQDYRVNVGDSLDSNDFGAVLAVALPLALWLGVGGVGRRIFWSSLALLFCAAVVLTASRGALVAFASVALVLIGIGARGWRRILTIILLGVGTAAFFYAVSAGQLDRMTDFGSDDYNVTSSQGRLHFWKQGMIWMIKRPWGSGLGNFPMKFEETHGAARAAHSTWVQYGMELGVAGLTIYILVCAWLVRSLLRMRQRAIYHRSLEDETLASHLIAMLTALMVTGTFLSNAYAHITYMVLGLAAAALIGTRLPEMPAGAAPTHGGAPSAPPTRRQFHATPPTRRG